MKFIQKCGRKTSLNRPIGRPRLRMGPSVKILKHSSSIKTAFLEQVVVN